MTEALTIRQLVKELRKFPLDAVVFTEGCDCDGSAGWVEGDDKSKPIERQKSVRIMRLVGDDS